MIALELKEKLQMCDHYLSYFFLNICFIMDIFKYI